MKKIKFLLFFSCVLLFQLSSVKASERIQVTLDQCVDGDTAKFIMNEEKITARFLAIDTPETKHPKKGEEPYGKEASNFTCETLKGAQKIELEYDDGSTKTDKYDRHLVWVWTDNSLLQDLIIQNGLAEVAYLYGDYKYTALLQDHEEIAKINKLAIWSDHQQTNQYLYVGITALALPFIYVLGSKKTKKKIKTQLKQKLKKEIQSHL